jgi:hypothetical protein
MRKLKEWEHPTLTDPNALFRRMQEMMRAQFEPRVGCCEGDSAANEVEQDDLRLIRATAANADAHGCPEWMRSKCDRGDKHCTCREGAQRVRDIYR